MIFLLTPYPLGINNDITLLKSNIMHISRIVYILVVLLFFIFSFYVLDSQEQLFVLSADEVSMLSKDLNIYVFSCGFILFNFISSEITVMASNAVVNLCFMFQLKLFFPVVTFAKPKSSRNSSIGKFTLMYHHFCQFYNVVACVKKDI